jgi:D,D-heptose 1,7-bisphosphate phosphatase
MDSKSINQCVILLGGLGTRLGDLTIAMPKPLLQVGGRPFVDLLIDEARRRGFCDFVLLAGHCASVVEDYASALTARLPADCRVRVSIEPDAMGTGGALGFAIELLADRFLLLNGDTWFDFNWLDLCLLVSNGDDKRSAMAARKVDLGDRYESLRLAENGQVQSIAPREQFTKSVVINGGVYVLNRADLIGAPKYFSLESDLLPKLIGKGSLFARVYDGFFLDIGVPDSFAAAQSEIPQRRKRPALFLDRDGVMNHDDHHVGSAERLRWIDGAIDAIRLANDLGYYVFVVTNQAGVAKGYYTESDVLTLHQWMAARLRESGAHIDDWRYCPFHPDASVDEYRQSHSWRKPAPGMIVDLLAMWPADPARSLLVGDRQTDLDAANAAGIRALHFTGGNLFDFLASPLLENIAV